MYVRWYATASVRTYVRRNVYTVNLNVFVYIYIYMYYPYISILCTRTVFTDPSIHPSFNPIISLHPVASFLSLSLVWAGLVSLSLYI